MLRILIAAIAGGAALQLWSAVSTALLPWPELPTGPLPPPTMTASQGVIENGEGEPDSLVSPRIGTALPAPQFQIDGTPPSAYTRISTVHLDFDARAIGLGIDLAIGLLAALAALALPENTHWSRRVGLLIIGGLFAVLVGDLSQAAAMQWPLPYSAVLCADHFGAVICVAAVSSLILFWPMRESQRRDSVGGLGPRSV